MDAYTSFAEVYDLFMDNVPYDEWGAYLCSLLKEFHIEEGLLLDLGCGTGKLTQLLAEQGYDMIGVDNSIEMLEIARMRQHSSLQMTEDPNDGRSEFPQILYLLQDMRSFELYGTVRAVYSACDCLNYILAEDELLAVFRLVNNYLDPQGIFLFDMNTPFKYEELLADNTFAENRDEGSFIWENYFDTESGINEYDLTLFVRDTDQDERCSINRPEAFRQCGNEYSDTAEQLRFLRFQETHYQRSYPLEKIRSLLESARMEFLAAYDGYTKQPLRPDSERMTIIARERGKN